MNKVAPVSFSLRKLLIAMLAVGPLAVLPSSLWATLPTASSFTVTNGSATVSASSSVATINSSDRAVLVWGPGNFLIGSSETYSFSLPAGGAVLNKVGYNTNGTLAAVDTATISGILSSNGKVFVLANGGILVNSAANINTTGGLVLSTLPETSDFSFTTTGNLSFTGASAGTVTLGSTSTAVSVSGNLSAWSGTVAVNNVSISGDFLANQLGSAVAFSPTTQLNASGNLSVTTNGGVIAGGIWVGGNATTLNSGAAAITVTNALNDFKTLSVNNTGANNVSIVDANIITLGASTVGQDLSVTVVGKTSTAGIATSGAVAVGGNATLVSASSANSSISFANGSSVGNIISAETAGGAVTINTTGALTVGNITTNATATGLTGTGYTALSGASATVTTGSGGVTGVTLSGAGIQAPVYPGNVTATFTSPVGTGTTTVTSPTVLTTPTVTNAGSGYTSAPTVQVVGGGGSGAVVTAVLTGDKITSFTVDNTASAGYTSVPTLIVAPPVAGATAATGNGVRDATTGLVTTFLVTNPGVGYGATLPTITFNAVNTANNFATGGVSITSTGAVTTVSNGFVGSAVLPGGAAVVTGLNTSQGVAITGNSIITGAAILATGNAVVSFNATAGGITFGDPGITGNRITANSASAGGLISQTVASVLTTNNATTSSVFNAGSGNIALDAGANSFASALAAPIQITAANAAIRDVNSIWIGTSNVTNNLTVNTTVTATNVVLGAGTGIGAGQNITVGGNLFVNATGSGTIKDNPYSAIKVFGTANLTTGTGVVTINASSNTTLGSSAPVANYGQFNVITTGAVTLAETTTVNLGNIGSSTVQPLSLTATSTGGGIVDSGTINLTAGTGVGTFTVTAPNNVVLKSTTNVIPVLNVVGGQDDSVTGLSSAVTIGAATAVPGNLTVGTASGVGIALSNFTTSGNLTVNSGNTIDIKDNAIITGNLSLNATGNFAANAFNAILGTPAVAAANIANGTGNVTGITATAANFPVLTYSVAPAVTISGGGAGVTTTATAVANLNALGVITGFTVTSPAGSGYNSATPPALAFAATGTSNTSITESTGSLSVAGTTTINAAGNAQLWRQNDFSTVTFNSSGGGTVNDMNNLAITGLGLGGVVATAGSAAVGTLASANGAVIGAVPNAWALSLGNLNVGALTATAGNGGAGSSGAITQVTGSSLHVENLGAFTTSNGTITLNQSNSMGPVSLTAGTASVTYVEGGTIKLRTLSNTGSATITSTTGSIIEDTGAGSAINVNGTLTLNAANGNILLGNTTQSTFSTTGNVVTAIATAPSGSVALFSSAGNYTLGNVQANSLSVNATGNIVQTGSLSIFGSANFTVGGNMAVTGNTNNFGPISITSTGANKTIALTESGTLNLRTVSMSGSTTGNFTATSLNGDIISTGFGGVKPGGTLSNPGTGVVTLTASKGNITVGDATTDFFTSGGVVFNGNNVSLTVLGTSTLVLGAATASSVTTGNLTVSSATGSIANAGNIVVTGNASFTTGTGNISLNQSGDQFGGLKFVGNQVSIIQSNDMKILTGSSALGAANLGTTGNISLVNVGGLVSFGNVVNMSATGTITLAKLLQSAGTLSVNAAGTKDLSALSLSGDLNSKAPVSLGTGSYLAPQP